MFRREAWATPLKKYEFVNWEDEIKPIFIEFREPWFLEGNKWWNMPWSRKVLQTTSEQKHTNTQGSNHRGFMGDCIPTCTNDTKSALFESGFLGGQYSEVFTRAHTVQWEKEMKA